LTLPARICGRVVETEEGTPNYEMIGWFAAFVPAKTPKPIVEKLNSAIKEAIEDEAVQESLLKAGIEPLTSTPEEADVVKAAGIEPE
jgi:tripartite-type tricarboxylate transporter receptor subunit TctC